MRPDVIWLLVGLGLIVVELMTGTFYLLIIGIAALVGAIVAYAGGSFMLQVIIAGGAAVAGTVYLQTRKKRPSETKDDSLDIGQSVTLDSWVSEPQRLARVKYRDALWDAMVTGTDSVSPGAILFITGKDGSHFTVSTTKRRH